MISVLVNDEFNTWAIPFSEDKPIEKNSQIMRLLEHKYIAESENHQCKYVIRVPLFQQWIQQYATID